MAASLVSFLLFFLYLVVIPVGISPFETPKVIIAEIIILILLIFKLTHFKKSDLKALVTPHLIFIGVLFLLSLDTQFLFRPSGAFFGNVFRLQGQFLFWNLLLFSILSKDFDLKNLPKVFYHLSFTLLILSTIILGVNENNRAFGTLGEPNALATTTLFLFPFVYFKSKGLLKLLPTIAALAIILLSGSRAGLVGFLIEVIFILISTKLSLGKSSLFGLLLIILSIILPFFDTNGWFENRSEVWETSLKSGLASPIIGHGFGNIQNMIHSQALNLNNNISYQVVDSSHNFLLDFWIQGGLVGLICILFLLTFTLKHLISQKRTLEIAAILGVIAAMLFNPVSVVNLLAFWWLIGRGSHPDSREGIDNHHHIS